MRTVGVTCGIREPLSLESTFDPCARQYSRRDGWCDKQQDDEETRNLPHPLRIQVKRGLTRNDWKGLWSVFWRAILIAPLLQVLGLAALLLAMALVASPPCYAIVAFASGDNLLGIACLIAWLIILRLTRRLRRWLLEGFEHSSL